jgi:hypothetical protein
MQIAAGASKNRGNGPSNQFHSQLIRCTGIHVTSFVPCFLDCGASYAKMNALSSSIALLHLKAKETKRNWRDATRKLIEYCRKAIEVQTFARVAETAPLPTGLLPNGPAHENAKSNSTRRFSLSGSCFHNFGAPLKWAVRACLRLPGQDDVIGSVIDVQNGSASDANLGFTPIPLRQPYTIRF